MFFVYIITNKKNGTLYAGHTDNIRKRMHEHKNKSYPGFSAKYALNILVWYETHDSRESAFARERRIKNWNRDWKIKRIEQMNPSWSDLTNTTPFS